MEEIKKEDKKKREEIRKILNELLKEDKELRAKTDDFIENLENGELKRTLNDLRETLKRRKRRISSEG